MDKQYKVIGGTLYLRRGPTQQSGVLKRMPNGAIVTAHDEEKDGWIYVDYEGTLGYCMAKFLEPCNEYDDDSISAAIETAFGNVYAALDELKKTYHADAVKQKALTFSKCVRKIKMN